MRDNVKRGGSPNISCIRCTPTACDDADVSWFVALAKMTGCIFCATVFFFILFSRLNRGTPPPDLPHYFVRHFERMQYCDSRKIAGGLVPSGRTTPDPYIHTHNNLPYHMRLWGYNNFWPSKKYFTTRGMDSVHTCIWGIWIRTWRKSQAYNANLRTVLDLVLCANSSQSMCIFSPAHTHSSR